MKKLELNQMEIINGGECTKTATKMLVTMGGTFVAAATGNIFMIGWGIFTMYDMVGNCEEW